MNCKTCRYSVFSKDLSYIECTNCDAHGVVGNIFAPRCNGMEYIGRDEVIEDAISALRSLTKDRSIHDPVHAVTRKLELKYWPHKRGDL